MDIDTSSKFKIHGDGSVTIDNVRHLGSTTVDVQAVKDKRNERITSIELKMTFTLRNNYVINTHLNINDTIEARQEIIPALQHTIEFLIADVERMKNAAKTEHEIAPE